MPETTDTASPMPDPTIRLDDVARLFGDVAALDGITLTVAPGEVVGLLGHNGAGKTTTVRLIAGLLPPTRGAIRVRGLDPLTRGTEVRRLLGVLPSTPPIDGRLSGRQNLRFAAEIFGVPRESVKPRVEALLDRFGLAARADDRASDYSTGMRQRLGLARVLLPEPECLLLDEPTAALDPVAARQVRDLIAELSRVRGRTVILCTHDLAEAQELCDRVAILRRGRIIALDTPSALSAQLAVDHVAIGVDPADAEPARDLLARAGVTFELGAPGRLVCTGVARERVPDLVARLAAADVRIYEVRPEIPRLEDVYLALHREDDR